MRWVFSDLGNADERRERSQIVEMIDAWWREFERRASDIDQLFKRKQQWDLVDWMHNYLNVIDERIMWEFGPGLTSGHRLVITPESVKYLRPIVETILDRAPKIAGWSFHGYRLAEDLEQAEALVQSRVQGTLKGVTVGASPGENHRIDLNFSWPKKGFNEKAALNAAFVAAETLLGEELLDKWIGAIDVKSSTESNRSLDTLKSTVDNFIAQVRDNLPKSPLCSLGEQTWTMWKLNPKERDDYPNQWDLFVGKSMLPAMWQNAHSRCPFYSSSYSRCGERFCYVKLDGSGGLDEEKFQDKSEIEDALDDALKPDRIGCHVGGGTGRKYSYIDLALTDITRGIDVVRDILRKGNVPKRSWILFFDTEWAKEWIGIWDDSPPPPMPNFE